MRITRNAEQRTAIARAFGMNIIEVEALRLRIDL
jgi:hypothetical protein